jgi:hypothetical protein
MLIDVVVVGMVEKKRENKTTTTTTTSKKYDDSHLTTGSFSVPQPTQFLSCEKEKKEQIGNECIIRMKPETLLSFPRGWYGKRRVFNSSINIIS